MRSLIVFAVVAVVISQCDGHRIKRGIITEHHETGGSGEGHGHGATSYQNVHIENFHPVPVYIKHGHGDESKHRIGSVQHNVKVSHGHGKHDYGHAVISGHIEGGHGEGHGFETIAVGGHVSPHLEKSGYEEYDANNLEHANLGGHAASAGYGNEAAVQYELQYEGGHGANEDGGKQQGYTSYGDGGEYSQEGHESYQ